MREPFVDHGPSSGAHAVSDESSGSESDPSAGANSVDWRKPGDNDDAERSNDENLESEISLSGANRKRLAKMPSTPGQKKRRIIEDDDYDE